jgi:hypothetical protein
LDKLKELKKARIAKGVSQGSLIDGLAEGSASDKDSDKHSENSEARDPNEEENDSVLEELEDRTYTYKCPVFKCTLRLERGQEFAEKVPLFYIDLQSKVHPRVWVKRSVALLLEISR